MGAPTLPANTPIDKMAVWARDAEVWHPGKNLPTLSRVNFVVPRGQVTCIVGMSGHGKSTLLDAIAGNLKVRGEFQVLDFPLGKPVVPEDKLLQLRRRMGILFQSSALFQSLSLIENVMFPVTELDGRSEEDARVLAMEALRRVGLVSAKEDNSRKKPHQISGGMAKRCGLARAMVRGPELLLCDEPSSGLDPVTAANIDQLLLRLGRKLDDPADTQERTIVVVSHDIASISEVADYVVFVYDGAVYCHGKKTEIRNSEDPIVRDYFNRKASPED